MNTQPLNQPFPTPYTKQPLPEGKLIINETIIRPIDRNPKDIDYWRLGHIAAERVIYPNRIRLYDLYSDLELDGHLSGIWDKRVAAVKNKTLHYYDKDGVKVDKMEKLIMCERFSDLIGEVMNRKKQGIIGMEFIPGDKFDFEVIERKHIKPEIGIIAIEQNGTDGFAYNDLPLVWVIGRPKDFGFLLRCAPYAIYKRGTMADWAQFSEIFGMPIRVVKYDSNDVKTKMELKTVVDESGSALVLMIPKQAEFEIMDGKTTNADGSIYENLKKSCDDEMSVIILGVTETTAASKSSGYAQGIVHAAQQLEITKSDLRDVQMSLNAEKFIQILASYGLPVQEGGMFRYEEEVNIANLKDRIAIDMQVSQKVPFSDDYWYSTYGIDKPSNYEELKKKMDKENQALQDQPLEDDPEEIPGPEKGIKPSLSWRQKIMIGLADFFDRAHKD